MENTHEKRIIGYLFAAGEIVSIEKVARILSLSRKEIEQSIPAIKERLEGTGITLSQKGNELLLVTDPDISEDIEHFLKKDQTGDLGNAALETLSIVLYSGPLSKREIDYIRGVNSGYILRSLLIRGLIEKGEPKEGERSAVYQPTFDLLGYLGIQTIDELPGYQEVVDELKTITTKMDETQ